MDNRKGLSPGTLARRLGVATTTLRTWHQRYDLGPTGHETGRHRRYAPTDVAALTTMARLTARGMPAGEAARMARRETTPWAADRPIDDPGTRSEARGLARAARRLDVLTLRETLAAAVAARGVVHTYHTLAGPAFVLINEAGYAEPRKALARRVLAQCLREVFAAVARPAAGVPVRTLLVAVDNRRDLTALDALAAALAELAVPVVHLGGGLPLDVLVDAIARTHPAVIVVWSHSEHPPALLEAVTAVPGWRPTIVTAGRAGSAAPTLADAVAAVAGLVVE
ncbi:MerR family transcriptional regulator [Actinoplanes sp. TRM 88003]|uniref:MerR family transcriptional regulator n=1 Tax=Paractinoplanes aksuensis TaxID=2939490 RepID=A0ABT1DEM5_9ACTN|nr:MerR family transcriptional regulator [Actinoplanes aksuensis]MCO8269269.1 MerR family transcriptional regulator [Actinoplanes aksuensis]